MKGLSRLTLEQRVGQIFFLGFQGLSPDSETRSLLDRIRPGGFLLQQRNMESLDQVVELNLALASMSQPSPLLAVQQEGGAQDRLRALFVSMPSISALADMGLGAVRTGARIIASELLTAGFNTNLFPVLDLGLAGSVVRERSFGAAPGEVARVARAVLGEFEKKGLISCGGHFPGLGGARQDPHFVLPRVGRSRKDLLAEDVAAFSRVASRLDIIMVGHGHYPALGDLRPVPASLSSRVIQRLLRGTLGYRGLVMTDDLTMGAITSTGLSAQTFLEAILAGNDMILFSQSTPMVEEAFELIVGRARSDEGFRRRIDASVRRILFVKQRIAPPIVRNRARHKARLVRQIDRLWASIPAVDRVQVR